MSAKVFSINLSKKKGIVKSPFDFSEAIEDFGLKDDAHAGDKIRQVSLLAIESINKQKECLKIKDALGNLKAGDFAENITTEGIDLSKVAIGQKLKVGGSVILEISKIGKECHRYCSIYYKTGSCIMPKEGIFARVLKGGLMKKGDTIEIILDQDSNQCFPR